MSGCACLAAASRVSRQFLDCTSDSVCAIRLHSKSARLLATARSRAGLSQRELAIRTGVAQPTIARIEGSKADPRVETLDRLLAACGESLTAVERPGRGVDRTQIRALLQLTPLHRVRLLRDDAAGLRRLERARR